MADKDGATGGPLADKPDEGTGQVPDKDKVPRNPDLGDEEKDALVPDRHDPHLGAMQSTNHEESMGSPYSWVPSRQPCWEAKAAGRRESTWLTQPMDQDIYSEWDPATQSEWLRVQDWPEQVKIHFLREGLHPEVAQWAMVTAEPTPLVGWYMRAGKAEVRLRRVQLLKQRGYPPVDFSQSSVRGHFSGSQWQGGRGISVCSAAMAETLPELQRRGAQSGRVS
uniref:Uncharacterized protein n=1 Tax=Sphaerodactylus townsendi TaxID=933632 RepID=A0ACB8E5X3_9SAUR